MSRTTFEVTNFIKRGRTTKEFYNFVTHEGTNFDYDINDFAILKFTALHVACREGNCSLVHALIKMGANVNCQADGNITPLLYAICGNESDGNPKGFLNIV